MAPFSMRQCRRRRRKCDENRPICNSCQRIGSRCSWLAEDPHGSTGAGLGSQYEESNPIQRVPATLIRAMSSGYQPFRDQSQFTLTTEAVPIMLQFLCNPVINKAYDLSLINNCAFQEEWIRDSLSAFSAIWKSGTRSGLKELGFKHYHGGCIALRNSLTFKLGEWYLEDPSATIASIFLGLFEVRSNE